MHSPTITAQHIKAYFLWSAQGLRPRVRIEWTKTPTYVQFIRSHCELCECRAYALQYHTPYVPSRPFTFLNAYSSVSSCLEVHVYMYIYIFICTYRFSCYLHVYHSYLAHRQAGVWWARRIVVHGNGGAHHSSFFLLFPMCAFFDFDNAHSSNRSCRKVNKQTSQHSGHSMQVHVHHHAAGGHTLGVFSKNLRILFRKGLG